MLAVCWSHDRFPSLVGIPVFFSLLTNISFYWSHCQSIYFAIFYPNICMLFAPMWCCTITCWHGSYNTSLLPNSAEITRFAQSMSIVNSLGLHLPNAHLWWTAWDYIYPMHIYGEQSGTIFAQCTSMVNSLGLYLPNAHLLWKSDLPNPWLLWTVWDYICPIHVYGEQSGTIFAHCISTGHPVKIAVVHLKLILSKNFHFNLYTTCKDGFLSYHIHLEWLIKSLPIW